MLKPSIVTLFSLVQLLASNINGFSIQPRIVNGTLSNPLDFPFFASIGVIGRDPRLFLHCSATVLNKEWILTAAHCLSERDVSAYFGINANGDYSTTIDIAREHQFPHPDFFYNSDMSVVNNDIG